MMRLSGRLVRASWQPYVGAFVALTFGVLLVGLAAALIGAVDATAGGPGVTAAERVQLDDLSSMFGVMAGVSLFMALFVVGSTFGFVVAVRRRQLGLLRLIGATPRQVRRLVLGESALVALVASAVGCALTTAVTPGVLWLLRERGITDLRLEAPEPWAAWAVAAPAAAGVALLGCWRSSGRAAKVPPVAALREASFERRRPSVVQVIVGSCCLAALGAAVLLADRMEPLFVLVASVLLPEIAVIGAMCFGTLLYPRLAVLLARPFVRYDAAARLARDQLRTAARTAASLAAPIVAVSAIAGSMIVSLSFTADWTSALDRAQLDAPLVVETSGPRAADAVARDPLVAVADERRSMTLPLGEDIGSEQVDLVDPVAAASARGLHAVRGDLDAFEGSAIAVSETWTVDSGLGVGDTIPARLDGRRLSLPIVAVVPDAPDLYGDLLVPADLVPPGSRAIEPGPVFVVPRAGVPVADLRASLEQSLSGTGSRVLASDAWIDEVDASTREANNVALWVLLGPSCVYAGIAIVNAILIGASQRRRQLRVARLLGATPGQVGRAAVWEAGFVGAAALVVGGSVVVFMGWLSRYAIGRDVAAAEMTIPWLPLAAIGVACAVLVLAAAVAGARVQAARRS